MTAYSRSSSKCGMIVFLCFYTFSASFQPTFRSGKTALVENRSNSMRRPMVMNEVSSFASSSMELSKFNTENLPELFKSAIIALLFGGGLIPASISANKSMFATLLGVRKEQTDGDPSTSLDPTAGKARVYVDDSGASGPALPFSNFIVAGGNLPLVDVVAIVGRIGGKVDAVADWKNLPSTKLPNATKPVMWLPRDTFKANVRAAKFISWPVDETGEPVGGEALKRAEEARIRKKGAAISDVALDAVFDTWAWGSGITTPDKVASQLKDWTDGGNGVNVDKLAIAAVRGRSVTLFAAIFFILIQIVAYGSFFVAPLLRSLFDIDIGFGNLGGCSAAGCTSLF